MGTRPAASKLIDAARNRLQMTEHELWIASVGCGGYETPDELAAFLHGREPLREQDYNAVAAALNDRLIATGIEPSVPYTDDKPGSSNP